MRIKVYKVYPKGRDPYDNTCWYYVDAPSKRIAKWCGAACFNNDYAAFLRASDMIAERFRCTETTNDN